MDIYLEPVLPKPRIVILGRSPVARILAQLGSTIGYAVAVVSPDAGDESLGAAEIFHTEDFNLASAKITPQNFVVVATQGEGDEEALEQALKSETTYIAFVASKTKATKVLEYLRARGIRPEKLSQVKAPAGLDIGAGSPEEIAVSILAEIIQMRAKAEKALVQPKPGSVLPVLNAGTKDPICGMTVDKANAKYKAEFKGKMFYFCCAGCKQTFEQEPQRYLALASV